MDIVIVKDGLIYFSNLEKESKFRRFLFYFAWTFLAIVPILEKLLFGANISLIQITTNIALTIICMFTILFIMFYQGSALFLLNVKKNIVFASKDIEEKVKNTVEGVISEELLRNFTESKKVFFNSQLNEDSWEKRQLDFVQKMSSWKNLFIVSIIFIIFTFNLSSMINSVLVIPTMIIIGLIMIISKPNNKDLTYFYTSRPEFVQTMVAIESTSKLLLDLDFNEHEDYEAINEFFKFGISCGFFRKKK